MNVEIDKVKRFGLTEDEVAKAKTQVRGSLVLGLENMSSRMMRMGKSLLYFDEVIPLEEIMNRINAVTCEAIQSVANTLFKESGVTMAAVGPFPRIAAASAV